MSRFSGPQSKGALRTYRAHVRKANFDYGLSIWNDGTGIIGFDVRSPIDTKRVANPLIYLNKSERTQPKFTDKVKEVDNG